MPKPKSRKQPADNSLRRLNPPIDIATQRRLRRDLKLTSEDIEQIDIEIAIEAGLLTKPTSR